jgi:hypothetical protein
MDDTQAIITTALSSIVSLIGGSAITALRHKRLASTQLFDQMSQWQERQAKKIEECEKKHTACEEENRKMKARVARLETHCGIRVSTGEEDEEDYDGHKQA